MTETIATYSKTYKEFLDEFGEGKYDSEYADYIMEHCGGDRLICNGDMLTVAMEDGYLFEDFSDYMYNKLFLETQK